MAQIKAHYTMLVYPFFHNVMGKDRAARLPNLQTRWRPWWNRLGENLGASSVDEQQQKGVAVARALDDTYFFLPYVRELLFPETALLPVGDVVDQLATVAELSELPLCDLVDKLHPYGMLRLTYDGAQTESLNPLRLEFKSGNVPGGSSETFSASLRLRWIDVALLPQHVGFLSLKVQLDEECPPASRLNDLLYYLRQVHKPTIGWQLANWRHSTPGHEYEFTSRDLVDFLLLGFTDVQSDIGAAPNNLRDWLENSSSIRRYSSTERGQIYGQTFRLYTYACLDDSSTTSPASTEPTPQSLTAPEDQSPFRSSIEQTLYELATCTDTRDQSQDYMPHDIGLKQVMEKGHIAIWKNWEAMALHDNVVFLGARPTPFTRSALAHNVESDYFHLYLLTLYQKIRLSMFSGELMRRGDDLYENLQEARSLWDNFTMFRNHYWFAEVTFKPQGTELYKRLQQGLNALSLYEAVGNEVGELQQYYERKAEHEIAEGTRKLQEDMAKNAEATKNTADRQLLLTRVMTDNVEATNKLQADMTSQIRIVANIQMKVEWIEIFVVGFYCAELTHIVISFFEKEYHLEIWWATLLVLGTGLIAGLITWKLLSPSHEEGPNPNKS